MARCERELGDRVRELGLDLDGEAWRRLEILTDLWLRYGQVINLSGAKVWPRLKGHLEDGLCTLSCARRAGVEETGRWIDVGSGGGFPGLIVAACGQRDVTLVEPREKRAAFLELACASMGVEGVEIVRGRVSDTWQHEALKRIGLRCERCFVVASARAVWEPAEWLKLGRKLVEPGGILMVHMTHASREPRGCEEVAIAHGALGRVVAIRVAKSG